MSSNPPTTPRIEDLRARLRLDPKARHFYPLAEDLRKIGQLDEAEKILRDGLTHHGTYLSAWMSLGRILAEKGEHGEAVEALLKALAIDPGNVVCARLLVTSYLALGDKLEAVKKLKLVRAVMPGDEEVDEQIARLESELAEPAGRAAGFAVPSPAVESAEPPAAVPDSGAVTEPPPQAAAAEESEATPGVDEPSRAAAEGLGEAETGAEQRAAALESEVANETSGADHGAESPSGTPPTSSPFITEPDEEPEPAPQPPQAAEMLPEGGFAPSFDREHPAEESIPDAPPTGFAEAAGEESVPGPSNEEAVPEDVPMVRSSPGELSQEHAEPFPPEEPPATAAAPEESWPPEDERREEPAAIADERTATLTMAELYARQGHDDAAREIYERVLERDPSNEDVRARLVALSVPSALPEPNPGHEAAAKLERWLAKVGRREL